LATCFYPLSHGGEGARAILTYMRELKLTDFQINTCVWLTELCHALGRPATLDDMLEAA